MMESIMYCQKYKTSEYNHSFGKYWYTHFMPHPEVSRMCDPEKDVYEVKVREVQEGEASSYWAWWDNEDQKFVFVHPTRDILTIVFPYPIESYVEKGEGKDYNVIIIELRIITEEEGKQL